MKSGLATRTTPFEFKGSLFTLTVMHLRKTDLAEISSYLSEKVRQAPGFFSHMPVVIDLADLRSGQMVDFAELGRLLKGVGMIPVGVRNGGRSLHSAAIIAGLPVLSDQKSDEEKPQQDEQETARPAKTICQPIRSGQQVYARNADLILLAAISPGAEVLADGNIHSYAPLRGRALAGIRGDNEARIFCRSLEAELVSVAGHYKMIEDLDPVAKNKPMQIYLKAGQLIIEPLL